MAGGLRRHAHPGAQHGLHVLGARRLHDRGGALLDGQVPGQARFVPAGIARQQHADVSSKVMPPPGSSAQGARS